MKILKQQMPLLLLAICIGALLAHAVHVEGFVYDHQTDGFCGPDSNSTNINGDSNKKLGVQINNDWYLWVDCQKPIKQASK